MLKDQYSTMLYTGWKKTGTIDDFKDGKYDVLVANIACIAYGFNLQRSHTIMYYSNTFSMEHREQSQARIFRSGQKHPCVYVDYVFDKTIDTKILKALKNKKNMLDYFREHPEEPVQEPIFQSMLLALPDYIEAASYEAAYSKGTDVPKQLYNFYCCR